MSFCWMRFKAEILVPNTLKSSPIAESGEQAAKVDTYAKMRESMHFVNWVVNW